MVVVGGQAGEDSQDGELGVDDHQLGNSVDEEDQPDGAGEGEEPQGNLDDSVRPRRVMAFRMTSRMKRR
jgi:hypothetical protein